MRRDIPEGGPVPRWGYGRMLSLPSIEERYWCGTLFGWTLFVARGNYGRTGRRFRGWCQRREKYSGAFYD